MSIDGFCREIRCCSPVQVVSFSHVPFRNRQYIATTNKGGFVRLLYRIKRYMKGSLLSPPIVPMKSLPAPAGITWEHGSQTASREEKSIIFAIGNGPNRNSWLVRGRKANHLLFLCSLLVDFSILPFSRQQNVFPV